MNRCQIDSVQCSFFERGEEGKKKTDVTGIGFDTVLGQPPFGDKVVEIQFVGCCKLCGEFCSYNGASAVVHWLLCWETEQIEKPDRNQAFRPAAC